MRLWSIHPSQLDRIALVACWREGLLAKKVLEGNTKGYKNHPQLNRFKVAPEPLVAINAYLHALVDEAEARGYSFDRTKLEPRQELALITLTDGQLTYEWQHLLAKQKLRSAEDHLRNYKLNPLAHPLFRLEPGPIADWEKM